MGKISNSGLRQKVHISKIKAGLLEMVVSIAKNKFCLYL